MEIHVYYDLDAVREQWEKFFAVTPTSSLTMTWQYAKAWWQRFAGDDAVPYIISVTDEMNHGLLLPLMKTGRNLSWMGDSKSVSMLYNSSKKLPEAVRVLGDYLRKTPWSKLTLRGLHSSQVDLLISALHPVQYTVHRETNSPSLLVNQVTWEQHRETLSAKLRADIRRKYRQLDYEGRAVRFEDLYRPDAVDEYFPLMQELSGHSIEFEGECGAFLREIWRTYAECGWLELSICYFDITPVAYSLAYTINGATTIINSGSVAHQRDYGPDKLLMEHVLENSFKRGDYIFDLQPEPEDYKRQWTDEYQPLSDLTFYQNPLQQHLLGVRQMLKV